jgi:hypothetical protein
MSRRNELGTFFPQQSSVPVPGTCAPMVIRLQSSQTVAEYKRAVSGIAGADGGKGLPPYGSGWRAILG